MSNLKEMAVPFNSIPVVKGETAKQMLEDAKTPLLTEEFLEECKKESENCFVKKY